LISTQATGPDKKHELYSAWKRKRDAYVKARRGVLASMPREARAFFENRGLTTVWKSKFYGAFPPHHRRDAPDALVDFHTGRRRSSSRPASSSLDSRTSLSSRRVGSSE
jgi:hypothetical protein